MDWVDSAINKISSREPMALSIVLLTRNRKYELMRALQSCIQCDLPTNTEFVVVDNASTDDTKEAVDGFFLKNAVEYHYYLLAKNTGAVAGRDTAFKRSRGRYVYFMDDDTYIDSPKHTFFEQMIGYLKVSDHVAAIMPSIFNTEIMGKRLLPAAKAQSVTHLRKMMWFDSGAVLVDRQKLCDKDPLFLHYVFKGMPELYLSLKSYFAGKCVIEMDDIQVIHKPSSHTRPNPRDDAIYHYTGGLHTKLIFYPLITYPILYAMFSLRIIKHLGVSGLSEAFQRLSDLNKHLNRETVPFQKFIELIRDFGFVASF